ncbi:hypothetical protein [Pseudomonas sp. Pseu.R1]|uniref:hypothetical protein n=1 Tax=Pseudomonas sp. Pseu.R1 TaxID=3379818 RepID=UPI003B93134E
MIFIETRIFTQDLHALLNDEEYSAFQVFLARNPLAGDVIQGTGGLRKIRWSSQDKGKRSGVRVIYYHVTLASQIRLILIYRKGLKDDLDAHERKVLKELNNGWE